MADATAYNQQNRWSRLTGQTLNTNTHEEEDLEKGDDESEKQTPRSSQDENHEEGQRHLGEVELPWEDDPANAHNWPKVVRIYHTAIPSLGSSIYTPGVCDVQTKFGVSAVVSILPFSLYTLGLAFGPMIGSPLSETFGRSRVYQFSIPLFGLFMLGSGFSKSIGTLIICHFLAGFFGSPSLSIGSATISDIWAPAERAIPMAAYVPEPFMGRQLGLSKRILEKRAKKAGCLNDEKIPRSTTEIVNTITKFARSTLTRPLHMLFTEPIPGLFSLFVAFNFSIMYCFFVAFPTVFETFYGFDLGSQGLTFLGLGVGIMIAIAIIVLNRKYIYAPRAARWKKQHAQEHGDSNTKSAASTPPPEWRLFIAFPGSILLPVSLFILAWTARSSVHWIVPVIAEALFGIGQVLVYMAATMYLMDTYGPLYGASTMAANTLLRYTMGFAFPLFAQQMYSALGVAWATNILGFVSVVLTLIPWCFWVWGPKLRGMSKYRHGA